MLNPIVNLAAKFIGDKLRETAESACSNEFARTIRAVARRCGFTAIDVDNESATIETGLSAYKVGFIALDGGRVMVTIFSMATWQGRAPAAAHVLMERMDTAHKLVTFGVKTFEGVRTRCFAHFTAGSLAVLSDSNFWKAVGEMSGQMKVADEMLVRHGYA